MHTPQSSPPRGSDFRFPLLPLEQQDVQRVDSPVANMDYDSASEAGHGEENYQLISRPQSVVSDEESGSIASQTDTTSESDVDSELDESDGLSQAPMLPLETLPGQDWDELEDDEDEDEDLDKSALTNGTLLPSSPEDEQDYSHILDPSTPTDASASAQGPDMPGSLATSMVVPEAVRPKAAINPMPQLQLDRPLRVAYHGSSYKKQAILEKVAQAVASPSRPSTAALSKRTSRMNIVPLPALEDDSDAPHVTLIPSTGLELDVEDCALCDEDAYEEGDSKSRACRDFYALCPVKTGNPVESTRNSDLCQHMCHTGEYCQQHKRLYGRFGRQPDVVIVVHETQSGSDQSSGCTEPCSVRFANSIRGPAVLNLFDRGLDGRGEPGNVQYRLRQNKMSMELESLFLARDKHLSSLLAQITGQHKRFSVWDQAASTWYNLVKEIKADKFRMIRLSSILLVTMALPFLTLWLGSMSTPQGSIRIPVDVSNQNLRSLIHGVLPGASTVATNEGSAVDMSTRTGVPVAVIQEDLQRSSWSNSWSSYSPDADNHGARPAEGEPAEANSRTRQAQQSLAPHRDNGIGLVASIDHANTALQDWTAQTLQDLMILIQTLQTLANTVAQDVVKAVSQQRAAAWRLYQTAKDTADHSLAKWQNCGLAASTRFWQSARRAGERGARPLIEYQKSLWKRARLGACRVTGGRIDKGLTKAKCKGMRADRSRRGP